MYLIDRSIDLIARSTRSLRHGIVKRITPKIYYEADRLYELPRPTISFIKENMDNEPLIGAEIGVQAGINAESILKTLNMKKLYLVDPYKPYVDIDGRLWTVTEKEKAIKRLERFQDKIQFIELKSDEAVRVVPNGLDFVYIDGNHDYEYVKSDIGNYLPKIKKNGVIGGHDFNRKYLGVIRAAIEFSSTSKYKLMVENLDWWIQK